MQIVMYVQVWVTVICDLCLQRHQYRLPVNKSSLKAQKAAVKTRQAKCIYSVSEHIISVCQVLCGASCTLVDKGSNSSHKSQAKQPYAAAERGKRNSIKAERVTAQLR